MFRAFQILVLVAICIGVYSLFSLTSFKPTSSPRSSSQSEVLPPVTELKLAAISFYSTYIACLKSHAGDLQENAKSCRIQSRYLSKKAIFPVDRNDDPLLCTTQLPVGFSVAKVTTSSAGQRVEVIEQLSVSTQTVGLSFHKENGAWKINQITCPTS